MHSHYRCGQLDRRSVETPLNRCRQNEIGARIQLNLFHSKVLLDGQGAMGRVKLAVDPDGRNFQVGVVWRVIDRFFQKRPATRSR